MKLIKLSEGHYVLTDDSNIGIGDIVAEKLLTGKYELFDIHTLNDIDKVRQKKIMRSTQPIEYEVVDVTPTGDAITDCVYRKIQSLSLSEVKELIGVVDVAFKRYPIIENDKEHNDRNYYRRSAYYQALEDNKERKYTEKDVIGFYYWLKKNYGSIKPLEEGQIRERTNNIGILNKYIQSLQPKTEWEVEMVYGKLKLKH